MGLKVITNTWSLKNHSLNQSLTAPAWIAGFLFLTGLLQLSISYPIDGDTAYHFAVGRLIGEYGILHSFPWTPFSYLARHYADKEFLFHLLFIPIGGLSLVAASRIVGMLAGTIALSTLYLVLRSENVRYAGVWTLLLLSSSAFVYRLALVRPHLLSIAFSLTIIWALSRRRLLFVLAACILYPLVYVAFWQITLLLLVAVEAAQMLSGKRPSWKPAAVAALGLTLGTAIHPNSINLIRINWVHMSDVLFQTAWKGRSEFQLGAELAPYSVSQWAQYLAVFTGMTAASLAINWRARRKSEASLSFALAAACFGLLTTGSARFLEYFAPFSVASMALASRKFSWRFFLPGLLVVSLCYAAVVGRAPIAALLSQEEIIGASAADFLRQQIPVGEQVFSCDWNLTGALMLALPERKFIVALDPTLFYVNDPDLYRLWYELPREGPPGSAEIVRRRFGSRFVLCANTMDYLPFFDRLHDEPGVRIIFASEKWVLYYLGEPLHG